MSFESMSEEYKEQLKKLIIEGNQNLDDPKWVENQDPAKLPYYKAFSMARKRFGNSDDSVKQE